MVEEGGDSQCIDLNDASAGWLDELPQAGPARAGDISDTRAFESIDGLTRVDGLGPARVDDIDSSGLVCPL